MIKTYKIIRKIDEFPQNSIDDSQNIYKNVNYLIEIKQKIKAFCGIQIYEKIKIKRKDEFIFIKYPLSDDYCFYTVQLALFSVKKINNSNCKIVQSF